MFSEAHALIGPAEAHGTLVGALCAASGYSLEDWKSEVLPEGAVSATTAAGLQDLFEQTIGALMAIDMQFEVLVPDDGESIEERTAALSLWCNGFLYGLGSGGSADPNKLPGDAGEVVRDLGEIARAGVDLNDGQEANESAYAELVEFVRVGVQLVFEELGQQRAPPGAAQPATLH
jgi:uncharacterized protein YgfB (UPF0149 family)